MLLKYFVLKPSAKSKDDKYAIASQKAMRAYARSIKKVDYWLAKDLIDWANGEKELQEGMK